MPRTMADVKVRREMSDSRGTMRSLSAAARTAVALLLLAATGAGAASIPAAGDPPAPPPANTAPLKTLAPNAGIT